MKSVFLVKTPLQLLNAIEAKHYFKLSSGDCILIIMGDRKSQPQLLMLASDTQEWGKVVTLNNVNMFYGDPLDIISNSIVKKIQQLSLFKRSFFYVRRLNRISKYIGNAKYIFMGYTRYIYMNHFANITQHEKVILLDDGVGAIEYAKLRKQGVILEPNIRLKTRVKRYGKVFFQGVKGGEAENVTFFTAYDISVDKNDQVVRNDFSYLRSNVNALTVSDDVFFIGSPLSEVSIVSQENYFLYLNKIKKYFKNKTIVYIAHRRESPKKLELIKSELNLKVVLFDYPIEYQLASIGPRPKILASFVSSALDSCRLIFGDELKIISFTLDDIIDPYVEEIGAVYESYKSYTSESFNIVSEY
ncbi:hypothetical protein MNBD_GAMMA09-573 [hydrothermal vent metagenome]|uniref:Uncharacterized protein n=1 Tax=hydrothermal vent metagenome TaxID=652676 RepID=A0A3B0XHX7_9ZZZZ